MNITRSDIEGAVNFLAANPDGATDLERDALAAYQADPEAAIERALTRTNPAGTVETTVMFSREQLRHAGARFLAIQTTEPGLTTVDWTDWGTGRTSH
ncbi:hypothetical protein [Streptomyces sp. NPDC006739]|uniref:hypothetical protein n=1 Tax=Streptomyces sp. NPDC006739 TaxID=3364763 RepID=UPI0036C10A27